MSINPMAAISPSPLGMSPLGGSPLGASPLGALANPMGSLGGANLAETLAQSEDLKEEMIAQLQQQIPQLQQQLQQVQGQAQQAQGQQVQALQQQAMQLQLKLAADQVLLAELTGQDPSQQQQQQQQQQPPPGGSAGGGAPQGAPGGSPGGGAPGGGPAPGGSPGGGAPGGIAPGGSPGGGAPSGAAPSGAPSSAPSGPAPDMSAYPMSGTDQQKADFINQYLQQVGSPAANMNAGQMMVQAGKQYNVDPLALLSIAGQETQFGKKGVGVNGMLGVGAYDADPRNSTRNPTFSGVRNQIFKGAATFAKLRAKGGSNANAPMSQQLAAVNRAGWASDRNWHNGVAANYSKISRAGNQYAQAHPVQNTQVAQAPTQPSQPSQPSPPSQPTQVASSGQ